MERQCKKLEQLRKERDPKQVAETLQKLRDVAQSNDNLMPYIIESVKAYATLGEICGILREVFGEYQQQVVI